MARFLRYDVPGRKPCWGRSDGDGLVQPLDGAPWAGGKAIGRPVSLAGLRLLAPVAPSKIIAVGSNYRAHILEMGRAIPVVPKIFLMPVSAVIGPKEAIEIPPLTQRVDHEAELAVVIGRRMSRVPREEAMLHVFGYTALNDVTARDFQRTDGVFSRAKGFDSFCPIGPWIETELDPSDLGVRAWVDDELRQDGRSSDLIFDIPTLLEFVSNVMTLEAGDVISTGTPSGVGPLKDGQQVVIEIEGIGRLENPVRDRSDRIGAPNA